MAATAAAQTLQAPGNMEIADSTTIVAAICAVDAGNYAHISVHIISQGGSSTCTFQCSNDNTNWFTVILQQSNTVVAAGVGATVGTGIFYGPLPGRYFRINVTGIASGTTAATVELSTVPRWSNVVGGLVSVTLGTPTTFNLTSAGSVNSTSVKGSAGTLHSVTVTNIAAAARFVKLYDKATAPTVGTDIPILTIPLVTAPGFQTMAFGALGKRFTLGIGLGTTNLQIDSDATAVTAGDLKISLDYV